jgi:hypothetical protein
MKEWIEELIVTHPKLAMLAVALIVAIIEAVTGVTVTVGNEIEGAAPV